MTTRKAASSPALGETPAQVGRPARSQRAPDLGRGGAALRARFRQAAAALFGVWAAYQMGLGAYFAAFRPPLLPEDLRFLGANAPSRMMEPPGLERWLDLIFLVLGGQMAALGMLLAAVALRLARREAVDAREIVLFGFAGALSVAVMCAVNFALGSDFRWVLILPVLVCSGALASAAHASGSERVDPRGGLA
ncbi:hypothetical protein [uncultured Phenylobacterium sp.]|uniref:hypothetical protein n=1 Tax=uncultured Phenylobacterium sp. TaxID=349273 RepID=UPI0025E55F9F|nr:hypothetical protein [uncultured Phenylobacterium sp.]